MVGRRALIVGLAALGGAGLGLALYHPAIGQGDGIVRGLSSPVAGVTLVPHRAVYDLALGRGDSSGGGVVDVRGRLALEFGASCEGFTLTQRIRMRMTNSDSSQVTSDMSLTALESNNGLKYRFNLKNDIEDRTTEEFVGQAELDGHGQVGRVIFTKPAGERLELPLGTVFPTEHLALLVRQAMAGKSIVSVKVFDGSGDEGVYEVNGFIGREYSPEKGDSPILAPLKGLRSWSVRLAYFPINNPSDRPQYEVGFRLFENGFSDDLLLDYGEFAVKGQLTLFEVLTDSGC